MTFFLLVGFILVASLAHAYSEETGLQRPTESCNLDLQLIVDGSGSVKQDHFKQMMKDIVDHVITPLEIGSTKTRVGLFQYSSKMHNEFDLNEYEDKENLKKRIEKVKYLSSDENGLTYTGEAMDVALERFKLKMRKDAKTKKVCIVFTDGNPTESNTKAYPIPVITNKWADAGVTVVAVGIGPDISEEGLKEIAGINYHPKSFDKLAGVLEDLKVCEIPSVPCGPCPGAPCCTDCLVEVLCHCHNASHPGFHIVVFVNSTLQTYEAQFGPPGSGRGCSSTVSTSWQRTGKIPFTHRYGLDADRCGTKLSIINQPFDLKTIIVFENTLKLTQKLSKSPFVILDEIDFTIGCNCTVEASASANFTVLRKHRTVINNDTTDVKLSIYCGEERCCFENEEPNGDRDCCKKDVTECCLKEDVCVHASWEGGPMPMLDELEIFPLNCWATPYSPADSVPRQDLIIDGCGLQEFNYHTMKFSGTSGHFCFQAFRFPEAQKQVFVHCQLMICDKTDTDSLCSQKKKTCSDPNGRRKRSVDSGNYLSFREVKVGPIVINDAPHTAKVIQPQRNHEGFGRRLDEMWRRLKKSRALTKLRKSRT